MTRINYTVDSNRRILSYEIFPFDESLPWVEVEDLSSIIIGKTTISIDGEIGEASTKNQEVLAREKIESMTRVNYTVDSNRRILSYTIFPFDESLPWIRVENVSSIIIGKTTVSADGEIGEASTKNQEVLARERVDELNQRVFELKGLLSSTDYKVTKCLEAFVADEDMPYDFEALKAERQAWRDEINELESEL
jgi:hypothetical protein